MNKLLLCLGRAFKKDAVVFNETLWLLKNISVSRVSVFSAAICLLTLLSTTSQGQAQIYYTGSDGSGRIAKSDGIGKLNTDGSDRTVLFSNLTNNPGLLALDLPNNRAFIYDVGPRIIMVLNLSTGVTTASIPVSRTAKILALKYDAINNYIYYLLQSTDYSTANSDDAVCRVKPDGTGSTVLLSGTDLCKNPGVMALDVPRKRMFVMEDLASDRSILTIDLATNKVTNIAGILGGQSVVGIQMEYNREDDNLYLLTSDYHPGITNSDAIYKFHPGSSTLTTVASKIAATPADIAFDFSHNKGYYLDDMRNGYFRYIYGIDLLTGAFTQLSKNDDMPEAESEYNGIALPQPPVVSTTPVTVLTSASIQLGGQVLQSDFTVTQIGLVYSSSNLKPVIGGAGVNKLSIGSSTATFSADLGGSVAAGTTYYARAYATSAAGTTYGDVITFTTISDNANLSAVTLSSGTLSPVFNKSTDTYTVQVANSVASITVRPTVEQANAVVKVNDAVVASGATSDALNLNVGINTIITQVTAPDGNTNKAYTIKITRAKSPQTITFAAPVTKIYGGDDFTLGAVSGSTLPVTYAGDNANTAMVSSDGIVHIIAAGTFNITASQPGNSIYLAAPNVVRQVTISKVALTYTADTTSRGYADANPAFTGTLSGFINGDTQASATTGTMLFSSTANATANVGTRYPINGGGLTSTNYSFTQATSNSTALSITKRKVTYTVNAVSRVYGASNPAFNITYAGLANGQSISQVAPKLSRTTTAVATSGPGSYPVIMGNLTADNYYFVPAAPDNSGTALTITKAALTFTANAVTRRYGEANPNLNGTITGFGNKEDLSVLTGTAVYATTASNASGTGAYPITISGLSSDNYTIVAAASNSTALTVTKNTLKYVATAVSRPYNTLPNPTTTGTVTGFVNGDTQASATTGTLSFNTSVTQSSPVGTYTINGSGLSSANYSIVQDASNASAFSIYLASNGNLSNLTISDGTLSPSFISGINNYTATVNHSITSITLTPTLSDVNARLTVNGRSVNSGSASANIILNVGQNVIPVNVAAQDGTTTSPYNVTVTRLPSSDATLSALSVTPGTLSVDGFGIYRMDVAHDITSIKFNAIVNEPNATIRLNGSVTASGLAQTMQLLAGDNQFIIAVTAQDGVTVQNYVGVIKRAYSTNNLLSSLDISEGSLNTPFTGTTTDYTLAVDNATAFVTLTPTLADTAATIAVDAVLINSGTPYTRQLGFGDNLVVFSAAAQDGSKRDYNITIKRPVSTDASITGLGITTATGPIEAFSNDTYTYNTTVSSDVTTFDLNPVATNATATITVTGAALQYFEVVEPVVVEVTAGDGVTKKIFTINVTRHLAANNLLQSLTASVAGSPAVITPDFDGTQNEYSLVITNPAVTSMLVKPLSADNKATVKVQAISLARGSSATVALKGGINVIPVIVMAANGVGNTYNLNVSRAFSSNTTLNRVGISYAPNFSTSATPANNFTVNTPYSITAVRLAPDAADAGGTLITVNGYAITGGQTGLLQLAVGDNAFTISVTAGDKSTTQDYLIHIIRAAFADVTLSALNVNKGVLTPAFSPAVANYTVVIAADDDAINIAPVATSAVATAAVDRDIITPGHTTSTVSIPFAMSRRVPLYVTAADGVNIGQYNLTIVRPSSNQALLGNIALSDGAVLSPAFSQNTTGYTASVTYETTSVQFTPSSVEPTAVTTVSYNGNTQTIDLEHSLAVIPLTVGGNTVTATTSSKDGSSTKTYTVIINRAGAAADATLASFDTGSAIINEVFNSATTAYTVNVKNEVGEILLKPVATDTKATVKIGATPVSTLGLRIVLQEGVNPITTTVTAQDGSTKVYTLNVTRAPKSNDATLAFLNAGVNVLTPGFDATTLNYSTTLPYNADSLALTIIPNDPNASLKVNGLDINLVTGSVTVPINDGSNVIAALVTAQDGSLKTYTITATRALPPNTDLAGIALNNGTLSPAFSGSTYSYTAHVGNDVTEITLTPTTGLLGSLIGLNANGSVLDSLATGTASQGIALNEGDNDIDVSVTTSDGFNKKTYHIKVTREYPSQAILSGLASSAGINYFYFDPATTSYTDGRVGSGTESLTLTPTTDFADNIIKINGTVVISGAASAPITINYGANNIIAEVTDKYGNVQQYNLSVNRSPADAGNLGSIELNHGTLSPSFDGSTYNYTVNVANGISSITVTPTGADHIDVHSVNVNQTNLPSGSESEPTTLDVGDNDITIVTTTGDGIDSKSYNIKVIRAERDEARLSALTFSSGIDRMAAFDPESFDYSGRVNSGTDAIILTPTTGFAGTIIKINGKVVSSGDRSDPVFLDFGGNNIVVEVKDRFGNIQNYNLSIERTDVNSGSLAGIGLSTGSIDNFNGGVYDYTVNVPYEVTSIRVTPQGGEHIEVHSGDGSVNQYDLPPGAESDAVTLNEGENIIGVVSYTNDHFDSKSYTIHVIRAHPVEAKLSALNPSETINGISPFNPGNFSYMGIVSSSVGSITLKPTSVFGGTTIKVNGQDVANGTVSQRININYGSNTIAVEVTDQYGVVQNYTLTITRVGVGSQVAKIKSIQLVPASTLTLVAGGATSSDPYNPAPVTYNTSVAAGVSSVAVKAFVQDANSTIRVEGQPVADGVASGQIPLSVGTTVIHISVTAQDGITTKRFTVIVSKSGSSNANLTSIQLSPTSILSPSATGTANVNYTSSVNSATTQVRLTPIAEDAGATIRVAGNITSSGTASVLLPLNATGTTTIRTEVTAGDGTSKRTYDVTISKNGSSNVKILSLQLSPAAILTQTSTGTADVNYTTSVHAGVSSVTLTPILADTSSRVKVNNVTVKSGTASGAITLNATGVTMISVEVTGQDGVTKRTNSIAVSRTGSSNVKLSTLTITPASTLTQITGGTAGAFQTSVTAGTTSITVIPTAEDATSVIRVEGTIVQSGNASAPITLNAGTATTLVHVTVTGQDNITIRNYSILVYKNGSSYVKLQSIRLNPASTLTVAETGTADVNYTTSVAAGTTSVKLTPVAFDVTGTIRVEGVITPSGTESAAILLNTGNTPTTVNLTVTGEDNQTVKTYAIVISKNGSSDVDLKSIALNPASSLVTTTGTATVNYTTSVATGTTTVTVTPTANNPNAVIKVEGTVVQSGTASNPITLNVTGTTMISLEVKGQDNQTVRTYSIAVSKSGSSVAKLKNVVLTPASPVTVSGRTYSAGVGNGQATIKVTPYITDDATVTVNSHAVNPGTASADIALATGQNSIAIVVTAQDGTTTNAYTLQINRDTVAPSFNSIYTTGIAPKSGIVTTSGITVHQAVSPNGDGQNDVLNIEGIENYTDNHLSIMNTGGQLIFETRSYNTTGNVFDGHSNKTGIMQKPGTYYYSLEYKDGNDTKRKTGYIILKY